MPSRSPEMPIGTGGAQKLSARIHNAVLRVTMGLLWGTQPSLIKALTERGLPQVATLGLTMAFVALVLAGVLAWRESMPRLSGETAALMTIAGATQYTGPLLAAFLIAKHIDAGLLTSSCSRPRYSQLLPRQSTASSGSIAMASLDAYAAWSDFLSSCPHKTLCQTRKCCFGA